MQHLLVRMMLAVGRNSNALLFVASCMLLLSSALASLTAQDFKGKNVILFITDQERRVQYYPDGWSEANLPGLTRLMANGVTFDSAFTNSVTCSSSRACMLTGLMPAQHGVRYKLRNAMPADEYPQESLPTDLANLATIAREAGYTAVYKGKIDVFKGVNGTNADPSSIERYGFKRWNPPDSGLGNGLPEFGWGNSTEANNDERYMSSTGDVEDGLEGALEYLRTVAKDQQPFFLVVSLVNPHDITFFETDVYYEAGYNNSWTTGDISLPPTVNEDLSTKPRAQADFRRITDLVLGDVVGDAKQRYVNFYANLQKWVDQYLVQILDLMDEMKLTNDTVVIKTSDHGETGLSHGGLRQKCFNMYEETVKVPLVISNPILFPGARSSDALVSHIDLAPTLQELLVGPDGTDYRFEGVSYAPVIFDRQQSVQDYIMFTMDDYQIGQSSPPYVKEPNHMVCIREPQYKFCKYFDPAREITKVRSEFEMYDLAKDPTESKNLAYSGYERTPEEESQYRRLNRKLKEASATRLVARRRDHVIDFKIENIKESLVDKAQFDLVAALTGRPVGSGRIYITNLQSPGPAIKFKIGSGSGVIRGNCTSINGDCKITGGTGTYKGITGNAVFNEAVNGTSTLRGKVRY